MQGKNQPDNLWQFQYYILRFSQKYVKFCKPSVFRKEAVLFSLSQMFSSHCGSALSFSLHGAWHSV